MPEQKKNEMWGGRFNAAPSDIMTQINASIDIDWRMYAQDIEGSLAHCEMLVRQKIITEADGELIEQGLKTVLKEIELGVFEFKSELEDIHMNIEARLKTLIGDVAGKLHTARSRNDQVATDFRLWTRQAITKLVKDLKKLMRALNQRAQEHEDTIMPGFTHLQIAQPITFATHLEAYGEMLNRDKGRFMDCVTRLNESPLGACALAGTSFPNDREFVADKLGFDHAMPNTLDAVASRDFALEFLSASSICMIHLSRLAEELIIWSTSQFNFIRLSDTYSTGSSIMPQKKNPDAAELIRAKSGRVTGNLVQLLMVMKALPLAYNKDMQEDKAGVFETFDTLQLCLQAMTGMIETLEVNKKTMRKQAQSGYSTATDLADWLVKNLNMPFRDAHHVTGAIVKIAEDKNCQLADLPLADMQCVEARITDEIYQALEVEKTVKARLGG